MSEAEKTFRESHHFRGRIHVIVEYQTRSIPSCSASIHNRVHGYAPLQPVGATVEQASAPAIAEVLDSLTPHTDKHFSESDQASPCADWGPSSDSEKLVDNHSPIPKKMLCNTGKCSIPMAMLWKIAHKVKRALSRSRTPWQRK